MKYQEERGEFSCLGWPYELCPWQCRVITFPPTSSNTHMGSAHSSRTTYSPTTRQQVSLFNCCWEGIKSPWKDSPNGSRPCSISIWALYFSALSRSCSSLPCYRIELCPERSWHESTSPAIVQEVSLDFRNYPLQRIKRLHLTWWVNPSTWPRQWNGLWSSSLMENPPLLMAISWLGAEHNCPPDSGEFLPSGAGSAMPPTFMKDSLECRWWGQCCWRAPAGSLVLLPNSLAMRCSHTIRIAKEEETAPPLNVPLLKLTHTAADDPVAETDGWAAVQGLLHLHTCSSQCKVICQGQDSCPLATISGAGDTCTKQVLLEPVKATRSSSSQSKWFAGLYGLSAELPGSFLDFGLKYHILHAYLGWDFCRKDFNAFFTRAF